VVVVLEAIDVMAGVEVVEVVAEVVIVFVDKGTVVPLIVTVVDVAVAVAVAILSMVS